MQVFKWVWNLWRCPVCLCLRMHFLHSSLSWSAPHLVTHMHIYTPICSLLRPTEYKGPRLVLCAHIKVSHSRRSSKGQTTHICFTDTFPSNYWTRENKICVYLRWKALYVSLHLSPAELSWIHSWTQHFVHLCWKYLHWQFRGERNCFFMASHLK